jgi:hypothetical protein
MQEQAGPLQLLMWLIQMELQLDTALNKDVRFPSLSKFFDGSRIGGFNDTRGLRDITLARSAETYLIAAEAKIRLAAAGTGTYTLMHYLTLML